MPSLFCTFLLVQIYSSRHGYSFRYWGRPRRSSASHVLEIASNFNRATGALSRRSYLHATSCFNRENIFVPAVGSHLVLSMYILGSLHSNTREEVPDIHNTWIVSHGLVMRLTIVDRFAKTP
ncbi:hypothetical protein BS47DRAFT_142046 [Hydnum rufescens UP504]|uniref:Uncharacterized protein n=1 Tax=Hydnum rufescens UP504 TaxID=1448309 RepID=A0A9P6DP30_9AGAM|nr:hypothetical protein BS47DRAFT_142046 [Hydnum rufescens UP504]